MKSKNRSEKRSTRRVQRCVGRRAAMVRSRNGSRKSGGYTDGAARSACGSARPPGRLARRPWPARVAAFVPSIKASGVTSLSVSSTGIVDFLRPRRARTRQEVAVAARSRAGGAARRRFPTLESGSVVRVGSAAGRSSRRRRLVSGRRRQEAAGGAKSCCSSGARSARSAAVAPPAGARSTRASRRGAQGRPAAAADRARPREVASSRPHAATGAHSSLGDVFGERVLDDARSCEHRVWCVVVHFRRSVQRAANEGERYRPR